MPIVLFYNSMFGRSAWDAVAAPIGDTTFTGDYARLPEADAVVFHLPTAHALWRVPKYPGQLWVAWSMESKVNYPALAADPIMAAFDLTMTYERGSDVWIPYLPADMDDALKPPPRKSRRAPAVLIQSSGFDRCGRYAYLKQLMALMPIHSYGRRLRNRRLWFDRGRPTRLRTFGRYKFCLAFENSIAPDYVTEKFFDPLIAGTVPVYRGAPNVGDFAPGAKCFINVDDFADPASLAAYLIALDRDDAAYAEYHRWRAEGLSPSFMRFMEPARRPNLSRLVDLVREGRSAMPPSDRSAGPAYPLLWLRPPSLS